MVRYYGRARQRIGSVNTNQPGLKQAGCPGTVGKQGLIIQHLEKRVNCNLKTCGLPMSGLRCRYGVADAIGRDKTFWDIQHSNNPAIKNYCHQVINKHNCTFCQWPQPRNRQNAGGVGNIWTSRRNHCEQTCSAGWKEAYMQNHNSKELKSAPPTPVTCLEPSGCNFIEGAQLWQANSEPPPYARHAQKHINICAPTNIQWSTNVHVPQGYEYDAKTYFKHWLHTVPRTTAPVGSHSVTGSSWVWPGCPPNPTIDCGVDSQNGDPHSWVCLVVTDAPQSSPPPQSPWIYTYYIIHASKPFGCHGACHESCPGAYYCPGSCTGDPDTTQGMITRTEAETIWYGTVVWPQPGCPVCDASHGPWCPEPSGCSFITGVYLAGPFSLGAGGSGGMPSFITRGQRHIHLCLPHTSSEYQFISISGDVHTVTHEDDFRHWFFQVPKIEWEGTGPDAKISARWLWPGCLPVAWDGSGSPAVPGCDSQWSGDVRSWTCSIRTPAPSPPAPPGSWNFTIYIIQANTPWGCGDASGAICSASQPPTQPEVCWPPAPPPNGFAAGGYYCPVSTVGDCNGIPATTGMISRPGLPDAGGGKIWYGTVVCPVNTAAGSGC